MLGENTVEDHDRSAWIGDGEPARTRLAALDVDRLRAGLTTLLQRSTVAAAHRLADTLIRPEVAAEAAADATETALTASP